MYHMLIKRQIIRLSNDIDNIKMCKRILQETKKLKKVLFSLNVLASDISLDFFFNY